MFACALVSLIVAGCVLGSSSDECSGHCWTPTEAEVTFMVNFCAAVVPCCTSIGQPEQPSGDGCTAALLSAGVSSDSALTTACLAEMQQIQSSPACLFDPADLTDPCSRAFNEPSGPNGPGRGCAVTADCAGHPGTVTSCVSVSGPGVCVSRTAGKLGDYPCLSTVTTGGVFLSESLSGSPSAVGVFCAERDGLACDWSSRKCTALLPAGSACKDFPSVPCASSLCSNGVCKDVAGVGQSCDSTLCDGNGYCDTTFTCVARLPDGASCTSNDQCNGSCISPSGAYGSRTCFPISSSGLLVLSLGLCV
jgi:hypothetical protein